MALQIKTFRRYTGDRRDIRDWVQDKDCENCGGFHRHRSADLPTTLRGPCSRCRRLSGRLCITELHALGDNVLADPGFEGV